jgi:hypothetical protein
LGIVLSDHLKDFRHGFNTSTIKVICLFPMNPILFLTTCMTFLISYATSNIFLNFLLHVLKIPFIRFLMVFKFSS